jgi:alanine dehydrogenase
MTMRVGCPKEIKNHEYRVGLTPGSVREYAAHGHDVLVETGAGAGIGADDNAYRAAGATIAKTAEEVFAKSDMIVKVKEPQPNEWVQLRDNQILYTYLHLAPDPEQTKGLIASGVTAVAYETVTDDRGGLPLLAPMSEVAGRLSIQAGATALQKANGGRGVLLGGVPGVEPGNVLILGGGVVGTNAAKMAAGMGAHVTIMDISLDRLRYLDDVMPANVTTVYSTPVNIKTRVKYADLVVGAVLVEGARAPLLIPRSYLKEMKEGSVIVDVAVDQGGCVETIRTTSHSKPTYVEHGVIHYGVPNMPGAVPRTSTLALNNATFPYLMELCRRGVDGALEANPALARGVNCYRGEVTLKGVADALGLRAVDAPWRKTAVA